MAVPVSTRPSPKPTHPRGEGHERLHLGLLRAGHAHRLLRQLDLQALSVRAARRPQHFEQQAGVKGKGDEVVVAALDVEGAGLKQDVLGGAHGEGERRSRVDRTAGAQKPA